MSPDANRVERAALLQMLAGAAIIGSNGLMVRLAEMPPTAVAFWRMLLAGLLLAALQLGEHAADGDAIDDPGAQPA